MPLDVGAEPAPIEADDEVLAESVKPVRTGAVIGGVAVAILVAAGGAFFLLRAPGDEARPPPVQPVAVKSPPEGPPSRPAVAPPASATPAADPAHPPSPAPAASAEPAKPPEPAPAEPMAAAKPVEPEAAAAVATKAPEPVPAARAPEKAPIAPKPAAAARPPPAAKGPAKAPTEVAVATPPIPPPPPPAVVPRNDRLLVRTVPSLPVTHNGKPAGDGALKLAGTSGGVEIGDASAPFRVKLRYRTEGGVAHLDLDAEPWAFVYVDNVAKGKVPVAGIVVSDAAVRVELKRPGVPDTVTAILRYVP